MSVLTDAAAAICLLLGAFFSFSAGVGVARFDNLLARLHVVAKPQVLGMLLLLTGFALRLQDRGSVTVLVLVAVFQLMTSPVAAHMVGSAGLRTGKVDPELLEADDDGSAGPDAGR
ncbi:monovalent cation/H(+) antiporter subunit G [Promicromonospora sp. NPDC060271]|uniref:monovalent cation/H(+) antiporter subunit G n=1 Tax=Promicromonospora sp. NPDC060271 TaxID=3347089 RepID=UPI00365B4899